MMLLGSVVLIIIGLVAWQYINPPNEKPKQKRKAIPQTAREILDERYANYELTREQYLGMIEDIEASSQYK